jgi:uncharacterized protein
MINVKPDHRQLIEQILRKHLGTLNVIVWAFGSRVHSNGTAVKKFSDLDLAIQFMTNKNNISHQTQQTQNQQVTAIVDLKNEFEESILPYRIDIVEYDKITPEFRKIIDAYKEKITF